MDDDLGPLTPDRNAGPNPLGLVRQADRPRLRAFLAKVMALLGETASAYLAVILIAADRGESQVARIGADEAAELLPRLHAVFADQQQAAAPEAAKDRLRLWSDSGKPEGSLTVTLLAGRALAKSQPAHTEEEPAANAGQTPDDPPSDRRDPDDRLGEAEREAQRWRDRFERRDEAYRELQFAHRETLADLREVQRDLRNRSNQLFEAKAELRELHHRDRDHQGEIRRLRDELRRTQDELHQTERVRRELREAAERLQEELSEVQSEFREYRDENERALAELDELIPGRDEEDAWIE